MFFFGVKFTYEHEMKKDDFRTESQSDFAISVVASYSGMSVDGGYSMSESKQKPQQKFPENVTAKQITFGTHSPASGGATAWVSEVKNSETSVMTC